MQLAICYELGFGCSHSRQESAKWLEECSKTTEDLKKEIRSLESPERDFHPGSGVRTWSTVDPTGNYEDDNVLQEAEGMHRKAVQNLRRLLPAAYNEIQMQNLIICRILTRLSRYLEALDLTTTTIRDCRIYGVRKSILMNAVVAKRNICKVLCRWNDLEALLSEEVELRRGIETLPENRIKPGWRAAVDWNELYALSELGHYQAQAGNHTASADTFSKFIVAAEAHYGPEGAWVIRGKGDIAELYFRSAHPEAESYAREVMALCDRTATAHSRAEKLRLETNLCFQLAERLQFREALRMATKNVDDCRRCIGLDHDYTRGAQDILARIYDMCGHRKEAQALRESNVAAQKAKLGESQPKVALSELQLADSLWHEVRWDEALAMMERAISNLVAGVSVRHPTVLRWQAAFHERQQYKRKWERVAMVIPISLITAVGRRINRIQAWYHRRKHNAT